MKKTLTLAVVLAAFAWQGFAFADKASKKKASKKQESNLSHKEMSLPPGVTPEQMEKAMKLGSPSDGHKKLDAFAGTWTYTTKFWMDPKGKPEVSKGVQENTWILDGRFLQSSVKGEATQNWPAFEGLGLTGYDNVQHTYTSTWMDTMSTSTMSAKASFDDKTRSLHENGTYICPVDKKEKEFRAVWQLKDQNTYQYVSFMRDKDGKEYKAMEIEYKRAQ